MVDIHAMGQAIWDFLVARRANASSDGITGDLVHVKVFGHSIVFVNSTDVACDLFEKRSSLYSDRLGSHTVNEW